jgi:hypothetical protein
MARRYGPGDSGSRLARAAGLFPLWESGYRYGGDWRAEFVAKKPRSLLEDGLYFFYVLRLSKIEVCFDDPGELS